MAVDRKADSGFARILLTPLATADGVRHVLVLEPLGLQMPARPEAPADAASKPAGEARGCADDHAARADQLLMPLNPIFMWVTLLSPSPSISCRWVAFRRCPISSPSSSSSGTCTSRGASASAWRSSSDC